MFNAPKPRFRLYTRARSYTSYFKDVVTGNFTKGDDVARLEARIAEFMGVKHVVAMPMARVGIYLALKSLIKPGDSVVMSPYTIADVVNMVIGAGGRPVFADVCKDTCNIDPLEVERLIDSTTGAVLITHLHGISAEAERIKKICDAHNIPMIEDAAQDFGAISEGRRIGTIGEVGIFSLGTYKNINSWFGGLLITDNETIASTVRKALQDEDFQTPKFVFKKVRFGLIADLVSSRLLFSIITFWIFRLGALKDIRLINKFVLTELDTRRHDTIPEHYLTRLSPFQARLALAQVDNIDTDSEARIRSAKLYWERLENAPGIQLPPLREDMTHIYTYLPVQVQNRDELLKWLMRSNRDVGAQHLKNCADLDSFSEFYRDCPTAREVARSIVLLPTYPRYGQSEVEKTADAVYEYLIATDRQLADPTSH